MICLELGSAVIAGAVIFASGMLALSITQWWIGRKFPKTTYKP